MIFAIAQTFADNYLRIWGGIIVANVHRLAMQDARGASDSNNEFQIHSVA
jgi:hypothetical protein